MLSNSTTSAFHTLISAPFPHRLNTEMGIAKQYNLFDLQKPRRPEYQARNPSSSSLHKIIRENLNSLLDLIDANESKSPLPYFVIQEFKRFLKCGNLVHGLLRLKCTHCKKEKLLAFSCKGRTFCPSCLGKRQAITSSYLVDSVFPKVDIRQWVLSFPYPIRFLLAKKSEHTTQILKISQRVINNFLKGKNKNAQTASVTVVQRFGSSLNLNPHFHILFADGVFTEETKQQELIPDLENNKLEFIPIKKITNLDIEKIVFTIHRRVLRYFRKQGLLDEEFSLNFDELNSFNEAQSASIQQMVAFGKRTNQKVRKFGTVRKGTYVPMNGPLCRSYRGFSLHANTLCRSNERHKLEKLCQYITRPPFAAKSIKLLNNGDVLFKLKTSYNDGTTHLVFTPLEFIEKLAAIVPKPRSHLIRYHGAFARNSKRKANFVNVTCKEKKKETLGKNKQWAKLLLRVFNIDMTNCHYCSIGKLKIVSAILDRATITKILAHLKLPAEAPQMLPARAPPTELPLDY